MVCQRAKAVVKDPGATAIAEEDGYVFVSNCQNINYLKAL